MSNPKDGGPAFPAEDDENWFHGMSLRDYFAAKALPKCLEHAWGEEDCEVSAAIGAYAIADAMLAEREKPIRTR